MKVSDVVKRKGADVVTIRSDAPVSTLIELLNQHGIGAVVVSDDEGSVSGIVSERDVVRRLAADGTQALGLDVAQIMTAEVHTCRFGDKVADLAGEMTERRIRHVPVVEDGRLQAIVSIGDVVKHRIDQLTDERDQLVGYLHQ